MEHYFKLKRISLKEKENLEPIISDNPELLEEGMKILSRQLTTDSGPLDIFARDSDGAGVIIELKDEIDDTQLDQGLRYYDWVRSNIAMLSKTFKDLDATQELRLILIAPSFSDNMKRIAKYVDIQLELKEYDAFELPTGERTVTFKEVDAGALPESAEVLSLEDKINFLQSEKIKQICKEAIEQLKSNGAEVRPIGSRQWASVWYKNKRFMYIGFRKNFFVCEIEMPDGSWIGKTRILTKDDWEKVFGNYISKMISHLNEK